MDIKNKLLGMVVVILIGLTISGCSGNNNNTAAKVNNETKTIEANDSSSNSKSETKNSEIAKETKKSDGQISAQWAEIKKSWNEQAEDTFYPFEVEHLTPKGMETWKTVRDVTNELLPAPKWKHVNDQYFIGNYKTEFDSNIEAGDIVIAKENAEVLSHYAKDLRPKKGIYAYLVYLNKENKLVCAKISMVPYRIKEKFSEGGNCRVMLNTGYLNSELDKNIDGLAFISSHTGYYTGE